MKEDTAKKKRRGYTLSQKRWMISLLIMKCKKHSSYGRKLVIP
jgi:hypothetical protein